MGASQSHNCPYASSHSSSHTHTHTHTHAHARTRTYNSDTTARTPSTRYSVASSNTYNSGTSKSSLPSESNSSSRSSTFNASTADHRHHNHHAMRRRPLPVTDLRRTYLSQQEEEQHRKQQQQKQQQQRLVQEEHYYPPTNTAASVYCSTDLDLAREDYITYAMAEGLDMGMAMGGVRVSRTHAKRLGMAPSARKDSLRAALMAEERRKQKRSRFIEEF